MKAVYQLVLLWGVIFTAMASVEASDELDIKTIKTWDAHIRSSVDAKVKNFCVTPLYMRAMGYIQTFNETSLTEIDIELAKSVGAAFCGLHWVQIVLVPQIFPDTSEDEIRGMHSLLRDVEVKLGQLVLLSVITLDDLWLRDLATMGVTFDDHGEMTILNYNSPVKFCRMLPSSSPSTHLIVGGERTEGEPLPADVYTLNVDILQSPDMLADACNANHLISLPDNKFSQITFDFIDRSILNDPTLLCEYKRILQGGGTVLFKTQHDTEAYYTDPKNHAEIMSSMSLLQTLFADVGFKPKLDDPAKWGDAMCYLEFSFRKP